MKQTNRRRATSYAIGAFALTSLLAAEAGAVDPSETDPGKIMVAVEKRDTGDKRTSRMKMKIKTKGRERVRAIRSQMIQFDDGTKQLMLFESPADVRNTGLLSVDYNAGSKSDDQWIYLPSMRKTTRISGSDKSGAFLGSDFSYSDMTRQHADQFDYKMLKQSTKVSGEECWQIEARPKTKKAKSETGYVKMHMWISKDKLMAVQIKAWVREGKKIKYLKFDNIKKISGVYVAHKAAARTMKGKAVDSTTVLLISGVKFDDGSVKADDFTQRRLQKGL
jgi:hypothetical protein